MQRVAQQLISKYNLTDSFYIASMNVLDQKIRQWQKELLDIKPYYALKCNPDPMIIRYMIKNNFGFDCASRSEIDKVISLGGKDILFAHPVKKQKDLSYAKTVDVKYTTLDNKNEVYKIKQSYPDVDSIIRLKIDNPSARVQLGMKYGATFEECKDIIDKMTTLQLNMKGVSFHVGSVSKDPYIYKVAFDFAKQVLAYAKQKGHISSIIDIGGGFTKDNFVDSAKVIRDEVSKIDKNQYRIIAEPGRFFAEEVFTFFTPIIGMKYKNNKHYYWIADSLYGSFNCILYDDQIPEFNILANNGSTKYSSTIFGSTCDSKDIIAENIQLPKMKIGDYLMVKNFGAYTVAAACNFNGIPMMSPKIFYV